MVLSNEEQRKIWFCLKLGNPLPCNHLSVLYHLNDLGYITTSQRLSVDGDFEEVYIYTVYEPFSLLIGDNRIPFIRGDVLLRCIKNNREILLVPMNKTFFEVGGSIEYDRYVFKNERFVDKEVALA